MGLEFYARKVYVKKYNIDETILEQYFSLESILAKRLYGISFKELKNAPKYYPDIQVYEVLDENDAIIKDLKTAKIKEGKKMFSTLYPAIIKLQNKKINTLKNITTLFKDCGFNTNNRSQIILAKT